MRRGDLAQEIRAFLVESFETTPSTSPALLLAWLARCRALLVRVLTGDGTSTMSDTENEDWIKTLSWDLGFSTLAGLFSFLGVAQAPPYKQRGALERFMALPAWGPAPDQLKREAAEWLAGKETG